MSLLTNLKWLADHPVTRQKPARTLYRWLYWQLRQLVTSRPKVIDFSNGTRLAVYPREGLTGYWYLGLPDYEEMAFLRRYLRGGDVVFDVGANAGAFAVLAAGRDCRVVAFEPVPHAFQRLEENVALNIGKGLITPLNQAVGSSTGVLRMTTGFGTGNHVLHPEEATPSVEVKMVSLDTSIRDYPTPNFIKIDVEGHELEVLKGADTVLRLPTLEGLLMETFRQHNWNQVNLQEIERLLHTTGFEPFRYDPTSNRIFPLQRPDEGENNTFYFRSPERIQTRLSEANLECVVL